MTARPRGRIGNRLALVGWLAAAFVIGSTEARAVSIMVTPSSTSLAPGASLNVSLSVAGLGSSGSPSLGVWDLDLAFDPSVLALSSVAFGDPVNGDQLDVLGLGSVTSTTVTGGVVNLFQLSLDTPADLQGMQLSSFSLATLSFNAIGSGTSPLGVSANALGDALGNPLQVSFVGSSVSVSGGPGPAIPEPDASLVFALGLTIVAVALRPRSGPVKRSLRRGEG